MSGQTIPIPLDYAMHLFLVLGGIADSTGNEEIRSEAEYLLAYIEEEREKLE